MSSIKKNYIFNLINNLSGLIFPIITFSYSSRILLSQGVGKVYFLDTIIINIAIASSLGIPVYAIREVARVRHDLFQKSKVTLEILLLNCFLTFFAYLTVFILAVTVTKIKADLSLFLLLSTAIIFSTIGVNWFYTATEDFTYITIRNIIVKLLATASLFIFVKDQTDVMWYAGINTFASVGSNLLNFIHLRRKISLKRIKFSELNIFRHLRPSLKLFALNICVAISIQTDIIMLGFMKTNSDVGYYTTATKLTRMVLNVLTSLGYVLLPRFSNYISIGKLDEFKELVNKAIKCIMALSLPMSTGLIVLSPAIIRTFCGPEFEPSIMVLRLVAPILIFIGMSNFMAMQILYPLGKDNTIIKMAAFTAVVNVCCNLIMIPMFGPNGAAISSLIAEFTNMVLGLYIAGKQVKFNLKDGAIVNYFIGAAIMGICVYIIESQNIDVYWKLIIGVPAGVTIYGIFLLIRKDYFTYTVLGIISKNLKKFIK